MPQQDAVMDAARAQGDLFAQRALDRAERDEPTFGERAQAFVLDYLKDRAPTSSEIITNEAKRAGITATDDRAFGGVYQSLSRRGLIRCTGMVNRFKGHGTAGGRLWELNI